MFRLLLKEHFQITPSVSILLGVPDSLCDLNTPTISLFLQKVGSKRLSSASTSSQSVSNLGRDGSTQNSRMTWASVNFSLIL